MYLGNPLLGLAYDYIYKKINPETALEDHSDILNELKLRKFSDPSVSGPGGAVEDFMLRDVTQREQVALLAKLAKTAPQKAATLALYVVVTDQLDENAPAYKLLKKLIKKLNLAQREAAIEDTVRLMGAKKARELAARIALSMGVTLETVNKIINRVFPPEAAAQQQEEMTPPPIAEPPAAPPPNHVDTTPGYYTYANAGEAVYGPTARFGRRPSL
jgi:hypothetical protein